MGALHYVAGGCPQLQHEYFEDVPYVYFGRSYTIPDGDGMDFASDVVKQLVLVERASQMPSACFQGHHVLYEYYVKTRKCCMFYKECI